MTIEKNTDYFGDRTDSEKLRNVANLVHDIVNAKSVKDLEVKEGEDPQPVESEENSLVDAVGKAISTHKPRGMFMHMVEPDGRPKT